MAETAKAIRERVQKCADETLYAKIRDQASAQSKGALVRLPTNYENHLQNFMAEHDLAIVGLPEGDQNQIAGLVERLAKDRIMILAADLVLSLLVAEDRQVQAYDILVADLVGKLVQGRLADAVDQVDTKGPGPS